MYIDLADDTSRHQALEQTRNSRQVQAILCADQLRLVKGSEDAKFKSKGIRGP